MFLKPQIRLHGLESHGVSSPHHHEAGWHTDESKEPFLGKQRREACCLDTPDRQAIVRAEHGKERFTMGHSDRERGLPETSTACFPGPPGTSRIPRGNNSPSSHPPAACSQPLRHPRLHPPLPVNQSSGLPAPSSPSPTLLRLVPGPPLRKHSVCCSPVVRTAPVGHERSPSTVSEHGNWRCFQGAESPAPTQVACPRCPHPRLDPTPVSRAWATTCLLPGSACCGRFAEGHAPGF